MSVVLHACTHTDVLDVVTYVRMYEQFTFFIFEVIW